MTKDLPDCVGSLALFAAFAVSTVTLAAATTTTTAAAVAPAPFLNAERREASEQQIAVVAQEISHAEHAP